MNKRLLLIICGILLLAGGLFFAVKSLLATYAPRAEQTEALAPAAPTAPVTARPAITPAAETPADTPEPTATPEPYVSPVDFEALQALNPDIYAWLEIDNTGISYPILQSEEDDGFYLNHNSDKEYSANGSIYSESAYNGRDLSDPVTLLYGHHMKSGAMFGNLQMLFSDPTFFEENPVFRIYTPTATMEYGVFAAVPYPGDHILYYHDFNDDKVFEEFFAGIFKTRDLSARFREEYAPEPGDRVVILSTCLIGYNKHRFLVMGTLLP